MWKSTTINLIKISIAAGLIIWLIQSGQLDLNQLSRVIEHPMLAVAMVSYWLLGPAILSSYRWMLLLRGAGYQISWFQALRLQLIGFFFNSAMPGAVGGDLIKVVYVIKDNKHMGKTPAMMSIFLDRLIGLAGLFAIGLVTSLFAYERLMETVALQSIFYLIIFLNAGVIVFLIAALWHYKGNDPFLKFFSLKVPGFLLLKKLYEALRVYRYRRKYIFACFGLSVIVQFGALALFYFIAYDLLHNSGPVPFQDIASIFPIGTLTLAIPLAPGGLGVGHVAFERLFSMVNLSQGANVFNLFVLSQLAFNMLGVIPYLQMKGRKSLPQMEDNAKVSLEQN
ncbi:MAG: lysylphosphatidylglycerol synthase transmembrane domain-containing protein [Oligoflexus sp.]